MSNRNKFAVDLLISQGLTSSSKGRILNGFKMNEGLRDGNATKIK